MTQLSVRGKKRRNVLKTKKINRYISKKLVILFNIVVLALVALAIYITFINAKKGQQYKRQVLSQTQQQYDSRVIPYKRGDIKDRNGTILATSEKVYNIILDCKVVNATKTVDKKKTKAYREPTIAALTSVLSMKEDDIRHLLDDGDTKDSQYQIIAKNVSIDVKKQWEAYLSTDALEKKSTLTDEEEQQYRDKLNIKGVWFEENYKRSYPGGSLACDTIGFTYADNTADWGMEGYYSKILNGVAGRQFGYFNSDADAEQTIIDPTPGKTVVSTIDVNIQKIVRSALENYNKQMANGPNGAVPAKNVGVVAMDPNNGEILAMDSNNWYDLNNPRDLTPFFSQDEIDAMDDETRLNHLFDIWKNFCITDAYEPGSTYKPMTVAGALDSGAITKDDTFTCTGAKVVSGVTIKCSSYPSGHGTQSVGECLENSCNVGLMGISEAMGSDLFLKYQNIFNFGAVTGIDLPGEGTGILHDRETMGPTELATAAFGQGFTCTMVQEASAVSSVINGGSYYKPHVVRQISAADGTVEEVNQPELLARTVSKDTSDTLRDYMSGSRTDAGDIAVARLPGYSMGGKSGTAEKIPRGDGKYLVSFVGFAPLDNPKVLVYVVVDEPNVAMQADNTYAKNIYKDIMKELMPYLNIFPSDPEAAAAAAAGDGTPETAVSDPNVPAPPADAAAGTGAQEGQLNDVTTNGVTNDDEQLIAND